MSKYFGEFLVEKDLINKQTLLSALVHQKKLLPSLCEVLFKNELVEVEPLLEALRYQIHKRVSLQQALEDLGHWNEKISQTVDAEFKRLRIPIGHILVAQGKVNFEKMTEALREFFKKNPPQSPNGESNVTSLQDKKKTKRMLDAEAAGLLEDSSSVEAFPKMDAKQATLLKKVFSDEYKNDLHLSLRALLGKSKEELRPHEALRSLLETLTHLKLESQGFQNVLCQKILHQLLVTFTEVENSSRSLGLSDYRNIVPIALESIECLWEILESLTESSSEEKFWKKNSQVFNTHLESLRMIESQLKMKKAA